MADSLKKGISVQFLMPIVAAYSAAAALLQVNNFTLVERAVQHLMPAGILGLAFLVFQEIIPRAVKEAVVFWRLKDRLPGCRAFSKYALRDERIDHTDLAILLPSGPMAPPEENALWYRWLKSVEDDAAISDNHRRFLILRECAVLLLLLTVGTPSLLFLPDRSLSQTLTLAGAFCAGYMITMFSARNAAVRLVCNVIARKLAKS